MICNNVFALEPLIKSISHCFGTERSYREISNTHTHTKEDTENARKLPTMAQILDAAVLKKLLPFSKPKESQFDDSFTFTEMGTSE